MQIKFFKKEKHFKKESSWFNMNFYWGLACCMVFMVGFFSIFFGFYLFKQMSQEPALQTGSVNKEEIIKKERIKKVLEYFSLRKEKSNQILNSSSAIIDPSL